VVLLGAGALVAHNLPELLALLSQYTHVVWVLVVIAAGALLARSVWKRRQQG
jgi:hypothetical protein